MMTYQVYEFFTKDDMERAWLVSILSDLHFDGFEETNDVLKAYADSAKIEEQQLKRVLVDNDLHHITCKTYPLEQKNWNEEWERNFEPVMIAGRVSIRAPFHAPVAADFELIIEPKMSFGTGHHATTAGMVTLMLGENFEGKNVLDFGSGTGVLAIMAEKLKAAHVTAVDHEEWAYLNCIENTERNQCVRISCLHGDEHIVLQPHYDIILANINRHVILANVDKWRNLLIPGGIMMVSGILYADEADVIAAAHSASLTVRDILRNDGWLAISFNS